MNKLSIILSKRLERFTWNGGVWAYSLCPFHKDNRPSLSINMERGYFHCFGCNSSGHLSALLRKLKYSYLEVDSLLKDLKAGKKPKVDKREILPEYILAAYDKCPVRLLKAGFSKNILHTYQIGYDAYLGRITFPLRDVEGRLVAISGRAIADESPRYSFYSFKEEFPDYKPKPHQHIWGLDKIKIKLEAGEKIDKLIVCEGFKAALWLNQHGYSAIALMGTLMTPAQRRLLQYFYLPVVLFLDHDEAGRTGTKRIAMELAGYVSSIKTVIYPQGVKQPDEIPADKLKTMIENSRNPLTLGGQLWNLKEDLA